MNKHVNNVLLLTDQPVHVRKSHPERDTWAPKGKWIRTDLLRKGLSGEANGRYKGPEVGQSL